MSIDIRVPNERYEDLKDLLRTCMETQFPYVDNRTAEYFLKMVEDDE